MINFPKIFVIVLNNNGEEMIKSCLDSVFRSSYSNFEVIVLDNESQDGSFEKARKLYSRARFILVEKKSGRAAANNAALRCALEKMADMLLLLDSGVMIKENTLTELVSEAKKNYGQLILCPIIFNNNENNNVYFGGGQISWTKMTISPLTKIVSSEVYATDYACGQAMFIGKEVFRKIGLLNEKYFFCHEDADFCLRARRHGFKIVMVPAAQAIYKNKSENNLKNRLYTETLMNIIFFRENSPALLKPWISLCFALRKIKIWLSVKFRNSKDDLEIKKAYRDCERLLTIGDTSKTPVG